MARRRTSIRTANEDLQASFLARQRALRDDPTVLLPVDVGPRPRAIARLARALERAKGGRVPFMARFDRGILGALRVAVQVAGLEAAPRMLDVRIDGNRRFFLQRGHVKRLLNVGVQNHDDPLALLLAYGPLAVRHKLNLFAGRTVWCSGTAAAPPPAWFEDLAERAGLDLALASATVSPSGTAGATWRCPHAARARVRLSFRAPAGIQGPAIEVCGPCGAKAGNLHHHISNRALCGDQPARPVEIGALAPDGEAVEVPEPAQVAYRRGKLDEAGLLETLLKGRKAAAASATTAAFILGGRTFPSHDAFLDALGPAEWERPLVRAMTAGGHQGDATGLADVLAAHRDRLPAAVDLILPGDGEAFVKRAPDTEARTMLRLARDEAARRERERALPSPKDAGPLATWIDAFVRDVRSRPKHEWLTRVRKDIPSTPFPSHVYAFLAAAGAAAEAERGLRPDQKEAGLHWSPLAKAVLEADGATYLAALETYLRETGSGEV